MADDEGEVTSVLIMVKNSKGCRLLGRASLEVITWCLGYNSFFRQLNDRSHDIKLCNHTPTYPLTWVALNRCTVTCHRLMPPWAKINILYHNTPRKNCHHWILIHCTKSNKGCNHISSGRINSLSLIKQWWHWWHTFKICFHAESQTISGNR